MCRGGKQNRICTVAVSPIAYGIHRVFLGGIYHLVCSKFSCQRQTGSIHIRTCHFYTGGLHHLDGKQPHQTTAYHYTIFTQTEIGTAYTVHGNATYGSH